MTLEEALNRPTVPVTDAGLLFFGLGREASYRAARSGDIPTIKVGGRVMAIVAPIAERLGLKAKMISGAETIKAI